MRGTANEVTTSTTTDRITPACAGNSRASPKYRIILKDHPRVCGEQHFLAHHQRQYLGSPPRVRGTVSVRAGNSITVGITPACAGNSSIFKGTGCDHEDHPRVCGEQPNYGPWYYAKEGSPPRVRGTVIVRHTFLRCPGITPACAGNRRKSALAMGWFGDHPRVCGEQLFLARRRTLPPGSPPRVRGTAAD